MVITNSGASATGVTLTDPTPADTTLVAGSVHASPLANHDAYTAVRNTWASRRRRASRCSFRSRRRCSPMTTTITDLTVFVSNTNPPNGAVTVNSDGTFVYTPNAGFTGSDSFAYTVRKSADAALTDTGTVNITVSNHLARDGRRPERGQKCAALPPSKRGAGGKGLPTA